MSIKTYVVRSEKLRGSWVVKASCVKGAIAETLAHLKPALEILEGNSMADIDLGLKVEEIQDKVTSVWKLYKNA